MSLRNSKFAKTRPRNSAGKFIKLDKHRTREEFLAYQREYYALNRDRIIRRTVEWGRKNKRKRVVAKKKWAVANKEHINYLTKMRQFRLKGAGQSPKKEQVDKLFERYKKMCFYCKINNATSIDHIIPISRGGKNNIENLMPSCISCNSKKGTKLLSEFKFL